MIIKFLKYFYYWLKFLLQQYYWVFIAYILSVIFASMVNVSIAKMMMIIGVIGLVVMVLLLGFFDTEGFDD